MSRRYREILPRQTPAQAADQARAQSLQDPVRPAAPDQFQDADFGQFRGFTFAQELIYPQFQSHAFQPLSDAMLSPHSVAAWGTVQAAGNWGGFQGRNADDQLSAGTSTAQMFGMGNAAGTLRIASDTEDMHVLTDVFSTTTWRHGPRVSHVDKPFE